MTYKDISMKYLLNIEAMKRRLDAIDLTDLDFQSNDTWNTKLCKDMIFTYYTNMVQEHLITEKEYTVLSNGLDTLNFEALNVEGNVTEAELKLATECLDCKFGLLSAFHDFVLYLLIKESPTDYKVQAVKGGLLAKLKAWQLNRQMTKQYSDDIKRMALDTMKEKIRAAITPYLSTLDYDVRFPHDTIEQDIKSLCSDKLTNEQTTMIVQAIEMGNHLKDKNLLCKVKVEGNTRPDLSFAEVSFIGTLNELVEKNSEQIMLEESKVLIGQLLNIIEEPITLSFVWTEANTK